MAIDFPNSPTVGDTYTTNGKQYRWDGTAWGVYGTFTVDSTASDAEPTGVGDGHIWYRSDQSQTLIRYDNTWVEVGSAGGFNSSSTSFPTSLDSGTGFAAIEALQAKVGVNSSAVTSSHDYKIADHASRLTTLEGVSGPGLVLISRTTIGSAVSSVTVSGAFSSTYANYKIAISEGSSSTANAGLLMTVAGAGASDHYSTVLYYTMGSGTAGTAVKNGAQYIDIGGVRGTIMDVMNAGETTNQIFVSSLSGDPQYWRACVGRINYTSIPASFTLLPNSGTLTGGYIDVYGYAKA